MIPTSPLIQNTPIIIRRSTTGRVAIDLLDDNQQAVDAATLTLAVMFNGCDIPEYEEDFFETLVLPLSHRIVKPSGTVGRYYLDWGDLDFPAIIDGVGGSYPTGFVGGETFQLQVDNQVAITTFQLADQTLAQVISRINATWGPLLGRLVASNTGTNQLRLKSPTRGRRSQLRIISSGTSASVLTVLGVTADVTIEGSERNGESSCSGSWLFEWVATDANHPTDPTRVQQTVHVVPGALLQMLPFLRLEIDKAVKLVNLQHGCFLGYTDNQLVQYLLGGLQMINQYQPAVYFSPDTFPYAGFASILVQCAMLWGVMSQTLFAIDTDITSYSDQGASFVINHQSPLASYLQTMSNSLDRNIPLFKLHFVRMGTSVTEAGPNFRLSQVLDAAPSGALFRNVFFRSLCFLGGATWRSWSQSRFLWLISFKAHLCSWNSVQRNGERESLRMT